MKTLTRELDSEPAARPNAWPADRTGSHLSSDVSDIVRLAHILCGAPAAYVELADGRPARALSHAGSDSPRLFEVCPFHMCGTDADDVIAVEDAAAVARPGVVPFAALEADARSYFAAPVFGPAGDVLGRLCVVDLEPRTLSPDQLDGLRLLARQVGDRLYRAPNPPAPPAPVLRVVAPPVNESGLSLDSYRFILENESDIISILEPDGRVRYVSPSIERVLGYRPEEFVGRNTFNHIHPDDVGARYEALAASLGSPEPAAPVVYRFRHRDGSWRYLESISRALLHEPSIGGILVSCRDVTDRRQSEERLRLLESAVVNAGDSVIITEADSVTGAGPRIVYVNRAFTEATGYTEAEVIGQTPRILQGPKTSREELDRIKNALLRWEPVRTEIINYSRDGSEYWADLRIVPVADERGWYTHWVGVQRDITERKKAEESLRRVRASARCLLWQATVEDRGSERLHWDISVPDEEAAQRFLPVEVAPGQTYAEAWRANRLPEDFDRADRLANREIRAGRGYQHEFRCRRLDGDVRWLREEVQVEKTGPRSWRAVGVCLDVTDAKGAVEALKDSEARYMSLVENVPVSVFRKDLSGRFTFGNSQFAAVLGRGPEEFIGKTDRDLFPPELAEKYVADDLRVREGGEVYDDVEEHKLPTGETRYVHVFKTPVYDARGGVVGTQGIFWDVTARRRAEIALEQKTANIQLLQEITRAANESSNLEQAAQTAVDLLCAHTGWPIGHMHVTDPAGTYGLLPTAVWHVEDAKRFEPFIHSTEEMVVLSGEGLINPILETRRPLWVEDACALGRFKRREAAAVCGLKGMFAFPVLAGEDVAAVLEFYTTEAAPPDAALMEIMVPIGAQLGRVVERQRAKEAIEQQSRELARSNAELEQFAYVASHDLQEPLRMVSSYMQLLKRRYHGKLDADADEFIDFAVTGAARMQSLILDLLAFSRVGTRGSVCEPVRCDEVVERALANLRLAIEESGAEVEVEPLPVVTGDSLQLSQVFQNLVGNALKFRGPEPPRVHVSATKLDGEWQFRVRDNGIGIDPQYADRVFIIFQRLHKKESYSGTGIGLAICKKIVERHGGRIWVESEPGQGATFCFTLPA
jgi:PAS domain S-box-containing protein